MANRYLLPIFEALYGHTFDYSDFDQRMEMQKAIYLLQEMGVPAGDYGFRWYHHGPYSQSLQDDMYYENGRMYDPLNLSGEHNASLAKLRSVIQLHSRGPYSVSNWVECLASLHYLRENILSFGANQEEVIHALEQRKPHFNSHETNILAYQQIEELFA